MFEALVVATATTGLFVLAKGVRGNERFQSARRLVVSVRDERGDDLPCPWCYAPTHERDSRCNGCGRTFG
jgi:ribosomal protein L37AE/L43A